jgi:hypothetical protein
VNLSETNWQQLGIRPQLNREEAAAKGVETKRLRRAGQLAEAEEEWM